MRKLYDWSDRKKLSAMFGQERVNAGISQSVMAQAFHVTPKTIRSYEAGTGNAGIVEFINWFVILDKGYYYYINKLQFQDKYDVPDRNKSLLEIKKEIKNMISGCPPLEICNIYYMFLYPHGGEPYGLLELMNAHCHTSMRSRVAQSHLILTNYLMELNTEQLLSPDFSLPDVELIRKCTTLGKNTVASGQSSYNHIKFEQSDYVRFGKLLSDSRQDSNFTQADMASFYGVSVRTIQSWESGKSHPDLIDFINWFSFVDRDYVDRFDRTEYSNHYINIHRENMLDDIFSFVDQLPELESRQFHFCLMGNHGSNPYAIINLFSAHCHTTMKSRVSQATLIISNYDIENETNQLICQDEAHVNLDLLHNCINAGTEAVHSGANNYRQESSNLLSFSI